MNNTRNE